MGRLEAIVDGVNLINNNQKFVFIILTGNAMVDGGTGDALE